MTYKVIRCIHLLLCKKFKFIKTNKIISHSVQEVFENDQAEIRVNTRLIADIKVSHNKPDIMVIDKKRNSYCRSWNN